MTEERGAKRVNVPLIVEYSPIDNPQGRQVTQGQDISQTGIGFRLSEWIPVGAELAVRISIVGHHRQVGATGRIVWIREAGVVGQQPYQAGFQFTQVNPKAIQRLVQAAYDYWQEVTR